jgi:hypothetical protein
MRKLFVVAVAVMIALPTVAAAKVKKPVKRQPQQQIACTVIGCVPVPRGCGQTAGRTRSGTPTGGDVIVCPPGVAPFR